MRVGSRLAGLRRRHVEQAAAEGKLLTAVAAGEEAERRPAETMAAFDTQRQTLDMQRQALETLIARTGS